MHIFVSGSLAFDRIMDFPGRFVDHILPEKIHILNVCFMVNGLRSGSAALRAISPTIWPCWGRARHSRHRREGFRALPGAAGGVGFAPHGHQGDSQEFTAGAYITTDLADNQITGFNPGAMKPARIPLRQFGPGGRPGHRSPGGSGGHAGSTPGPTVPGMRYISIRGRASRPGGAKTSGRWRTAPWPSSSTTTSWRCSGRKPAWTSPES